MKISYDHLNEWIDLRAQNISAEKMGEMLTSRGIEVESIESAGKGLEKVITAKIMSREPHPDATKLSLCKMDLGKQEALEIVCGAQNMKAGDVVCLAQIGALLPNGLKIEKSKIRGVVSNGMLCSETELGLADTSEGILILPAGTPLGKDIREVIGKTDTVMDLKVTANRGDCLSYKGVAREVAAALKIDLSKTLAKFVKPEFHEIKNAGLKIDLSLSPDGKKAAPRFIAAKLENVKVGTSPEAWIKKLAANGIRSINNIVDATNLVMLELGHPVHAYDALKMKNVIGVRQANAGEKIELLDDSVIDAKGQELVIFTSDKAEGNQNAIAVGLAGVMGGKASSVSDATTTLILECAEFSQNRVRKAAHVHTKTTDASSRFARGVDASQMTAVMNRLIALITEVSPGAKVTAFEKAETSKLEAITVQTSVSQITEFLGADLAANEVLESIENQGCKIERKGDDSFSVSIPFHRHDLKIWQDLAEEVARSVGYDRIPETLPVLTSSPKPYFFDVKNAELVLRDRLKDVCLDLGLNETLNYGFSSAKILNQFGLDAKVKVVNPLSEENEYMVPSLVPGLLQNAAHNTRHHFGSAPLAIRLFEVRPTFHLKADRPESLTRETQLAGDTGVDEIAKLAFAISGPRFAQGLKTELGEVNFYDAKAIFESFIERLGVKGIRTRELKAETAFERTVFHPFQSLEIWAGQKRIGALGALHPVLQDQLKLRAPLFICELEVASLLQMARKASQSPVFTALSLFPGMERDYAVLVSKTTESEKLIQAALKSGKPLAKSAQVFDTYEGTGVPNGMRSIAFRVSFSGDGKSLVETEVEATSQKIRDALTKEFSLQFR